MQKKIINKKTIRKLVEGIVNELDWKTIQNVADTNGRGEWQSMKNDNAAIDAFNRDYGYNGKNGTVKRSCPNDSILDVYYDTGFDVDDPILNYGTSYIDGNGKRVIFNQSLSDKEKQRRILSPEDFFNNDQDAIKGYNRAASEIDDKRLGKYKYEKGKGWNKEERLRKLVESHVRKMLIGL